MLRRFGQQQGRLRPVSQPVPPVRFLTIDDVDRETRKLWQDYNVLQRTAEDANIGRSVRIRLPISYRVVNF